MSSTSDKLQETFPLLMETAQTSTTSFRHWKADDVHPYESLGYTMQAVEQLIKRVQELEKERA